MNKSGLTKTFNFSIRIIKLYQYLVQEKNEFVLSKQLLKSGTSIGANAEEAVGGQTTKGFGAKLTIAYKEAWETHYWLRLMAAAHIIEKNTAESLLKD